MQRGAVIRAERKVRRLPCSVCLHSEAVLCSRRDLALALPAVLCSPRSGYRRSRISKEMRGAVVIIAGASARTPGSHASRVELLEARLPVPEIRLPWIARLFWRRSAAPGCDPSNRDRQIRFFALGGKRGCFLVRVAGEKPAAGSYRYAFRPGSLRYRLLWPVRETAPDGNADVFSES